MTDTELDSVSVPRVEAIDRALTLLTVLAKAGPAGLSLAALAAESGLNKSTIHRALGTLAARGFTTKTPGGHHALGSTALSLGDQFNNFHHVLGAMRPALFELSRVSDELVHLGVWEGGDIIYLDKVEPSSRALRVWSVVGQRVPVASTALGRALLAASPIADDQMIAFVRDTSAKRPVSAERLRDAIADCRRLGFSSEHEENEPGVACIGIALIRRNTAFAAVSITAPASRMTPERQVELAALAHRVLPPLLPEGVSLYAPSPSIGASSS